MATLYDYCKENNKEYLLKEWDYELNKDLDPKIILFKSNKKVWWKCIKCNHKWCASVNSRIGRNSNCPACSGRVPRIGINDLFTVNPDLEKEWDFELNKDINPYTMHAGSHTKVWWKCSKCGYKWLAEPKRRTKGSKCPCCMNRVAVAGTNDLAATHPEIAKEWHPTKNNTLMPQNTTAGSNKSVWWKCSVCGYEWQASPNSRTSRNSGCIQCRKHKNKDIENCLEITHPEIAKDWNYDKNGSYKPSQFRRGSNFLVWWKCSKCGFEVQRAIHDYKGCPRCKTLDKIKDEDLLINNKNLMLEWDYELNADIDLTTLSKGSSRHAWWICSYCGHKWRTTIYHRATQGSSCPFCRHDTRISFQQKENLNNTHPELVKDWDKNKNGKLTPELFTKNSNFKVWWKCHACGKEVEKEIKGYNGCSDCKKQAILNERNLSITHPNLLLEWDYNKNKTFKPTDVLASNSNKAWWKCKQCGYEWQAKISNRAVLGRGCPCCANTVVVKGINDLATTHPNIAKEWHPTKNGELTPQNVTHGTGKKVWWLCPEGHEYQATILHRAQETGTDCPICNSGRQTSFAEQATFYYVKKLYPDAINRYTADFLGRMELDIYIPSINCAIEYDGEAWHKGKAKIKREEKKYKICKSKNIKLIRLREKEVPSDICIADMQFYQNKLYEYPKLEKTIRMLLEYINLNNDINTIDINIKRDKETILQYKTILKKDTLQDKYPEIAKEWHPTKNGSLKPNMFKSGSHHKVWWLCPKCGNEYKSTISHRTSQKQPTSCPKCAIKRSSLAKARKVNMIDITNNKILKTFVSISEAARQLHINSSNIGSVCKGKRPYTGGYKWEYAE